MTEADPLSNALCPWLKPALQQFEASLQQERLGHAWLIHGSAGIGKLNLALFLANRLLSGSNNVAPADLSATDFLAGMRARYEPRNHHPDLHRLHPEEGKQSIGIEPVREICATLSLSSYGAGARVVIVEPAEAMTVSAANALLKTLEEPTPGSYLLLISHRPGMLPATIRSRCQKLQINAPDDAMFAQWRGTAGLDAAPAAAELTPLAQLESLSAERSDDSAARAAQLTSLLGARGNPLAVADEWAKGDVDHILEWLVRTLHALIRLRFDENASKLITESGGASLHNAALAMSLRGLFFRLEEAERLRGDLAGGINVQLALRALLLGFVPDKGLT